MSNADFDKHIRVVLRGRKKSLSRDTCLDDELLAEVYFRALSATDVEGALATLEFEVNSTARKETSALLIAYFDWCFQIGKDSVEGHPLREFVDRFARITIRRLCGRLEDSLPTDSYRLPHWISPNIAFGWERPNWRPRDESLSEIGSRVAAYVELQTRNGYSASEAKRRAATHFSKPERIYSRSWVEKRLKESNLPAENLAEASVAELRAYLAEFAEK